VEGGRATRPDTTDVTKSPHDHVMPFGLSGCMVSLPFDRASLRRAHQVRGGWRHVEEAYPVGDTFSVELQGVAYLHHDWMRGEWVQRFLRPGEGTLEPDGVLPQATHYFVHPVLSDVVGRLNPGYLQHVDRINIVGYGRPWRLRPGDSAVTARTLCVLTGDVHPLLLRREREGAHPPSNVP
jgi:hypothetical protein